MADSSRTVTIKFQGDTASLVAATVEGDAALKELNKSAGDTSGLDKAASSADNTSSHFSLLAAAIVAAAPVAGAAIIAGVGAAFIGLAAIADKNNPLVLDSFNNLTEGISTETKAAAASLAGPLAGALDTLNKTAIAAKEPLDSIFDEIAPDIPLLASGLSQMATNLLPGLDKAAQNSVPVFQGLSSVLDEVGITGDDVLTTLSNNAKNFGAVMTSTGSIVQSAGDLVGNVASDLGTVWGQNSGQVDTAVSGIGHDLTGLASGAVPVLSGALRVVSTDVGAVVDALGPLTGVLGAVGASAGLAFGAFKLAGAVNSGVGSLAGSILDLGVKVEGTSPKLATMLGSTAATAESLAGPFGAAVVGGGIVLGVLASVMDKTAISSQDLSDAQQALTSAMVSSNGQLTAASTSALVSSDAYKALQSSAQAAGISQAQVIQAVTQGGSAYSNLQTQLQGVTAAGVTYSYNGRTSTTTSTASAEAAQNLSQGLGQLRGTYEDAATAAQAADDAQKAVAQSAPAAALNTSQIAVNMKTLSDNTSSASAKLSAFLNNVHLLAEGGTEDANDAIAQVYTQMNNLTSSLTGTSGALLKTGGDFDLTTTKGEAARTAVKAISDQTNTYYQALLNQGVGADSAQQQSDALASQLVGPMAKALGITTDQATSLLHTYGAFPSAINTQVGANTAPAANALQSLINQYDSATITLKTSITGGGSLSSELHANGGIFAPRMHASGGLIAPPNSFIPLNGGADVVGDRSDVNESYIPWDGSARSLQILAATNAAMGVGRSYLTDSPSSVSPVSGASQSSDTSSSDGGQFSGTLTLDSGQFLGMVSGQITKSNRALKAKAMAKGGKA